MAIFGQYTGARVAPLPSGFMGAAMTSAGNIQRGLTSMGESLGKALEQYGRNKEKSETMDGLIGAAAMQAAENKPFYDRLQGSEAPRELSPEDRAVAPPGITHSVKSEQGVTTPGPAPGADFLAEAAGGQKLYDKFLAGNASLADKSAILANLQMYNAKGDQLFKRMQMNQLLAQDAVNRNDYPLIEDLPTVESVPPVDRFVSEKVSGKRVLGLIAKYKAGGGNAPSEEFPDLGMTKGELYVNQDPDDEALLEALKANGFDITKYAREEEHPYQSRKAFPDGKLENRASEIDNQIIDLGKYIRGEKRQPRSFDGGQPMRKSEMHDLITSLGKESDEIRAELSRRNDADEYMRKRSDIESARNREVAKLLDEHTSLSQYFLGAGDPSKARTLDEVRGVTRPFQEGEVDAVRGDASERMRAIQAETSNIRRQSQRDLDALQADYPEAHAVAFPRPVPPLPRLKNSYEIGVSETIPQPDKVIPGEVREMTDAEKKAHDIKTYVDAGGLLDNRAMAEINARYPQGRIRSEPIEGVPGATALFDGASGKFLQVVTPPTLSASDRAAVAAVTFTPNTGFTGVVPTKEEAVKMRELIATTNEVNTMLDDLMEMAKEEEVEWVGEKKARANAMIATLVGKMRIPLTGGGPLTLEERKYIQENLFTNPYDWKTWSETSQAQIDTVKGMMNNAMGRRAEVLGLTPVGGTAGGNQPAPAPAGARRFDRTGKEIK